LLAVVLEDPVWVGAFVVDVVAPEDVVAPDDEVVAAVVDVVVEPEVEVVLAGLVVVVAGRVVDEVGRVVVGSRRGAVVVGASVVAGETLMVVVPPLFCVQETGTWL
jgi:hypothetical protein